MQCTSLLPAREFECLCLLQGMHLVEGGAALRQLAERWKQKARWAFTIVHSPVEPGAKGLALPPLPGMSHSMQVQICRDSFRTHASSCADFHDMLKVARGM